MQKIKHLFLVTLPICPYDQENERYHRIKLQMNDALREIVKKSDAQPRSMKITLIDVANYAPLNYLECLFKEEEDGDSHCHIWDDGLHFRPKGYDMLGAFIFKSISPIIINDFMHKE